MDDEAERSARRYIMESLALSEGRAGDEGWPSDEEIERAVQQVARVTRQWKRAIAQQARRRAADAPNG